MTARSHLLTRPEALREKAVTVGPVPILIATICLYDYLQRLCFFRKMIFISGISSIFIFHCFHAFSDGLTLAHLWQSHDCSLFGIVSNVRQTPVVIFDCLSCQWFDLDTNASCDWCWDCLLTLMSIVSPCLHQLHKAEVLGHRRLCCVVVFVLLECEIQAASWILGSPLKFTQSLTFWISAAVDLCILSSSWCCYLLNS